MQGASPCMVPCGSGKITATDIEAGNPDIIRFAGERALPERACPSGAVSATDRVLLEAQGHHQAVPHVDDGDDTQEFDDLGL